MKKIILAPVITLFVVMCGFATQERNYDLKDKKAVVSGSVDDKIDIKSDDGKVNLYSKQTRLVDADGFHKSHKENTKKKVKDSDEDDNPNLADLSQPAPNIQRNLRMPSEEEQRVSRQMQLEGAQGGIQNTGPRGIGNPSQY